MFPERQQLSGHLRLGARNFVLWAATDCSRPMTPSPNVRDAIDDLICEIFLRLTQELSGVGIEDPQESVLTTLREVEQEWRTSTLASSKLKDSHRDRGERVKATLQSLSANEKDALFLHLGRGMRCAEIARETGVSRWAVLNDLIRAYCRLRLRLGDLDFSDIYRR